VEKVVVLFVFKNVTPGVLWAHKIIGEREKNFDLHKLKIMMSAI